MSDDTNRLLGRIEGALEGVRGELSILRSELVAFRDASLPQRVSQLEAELHELRAMISSGVKFAIGGAASGGGIVALVQTLFGG